MGYIKKYPSETSVPGGIVIVSLKDKDTGKPAGVKEYRANRYVIYEDKSLSLFNDDDLVISFGVNEWRSVG